MMMALAHQVWGDAPACEECATSASARAQNGCDAPASEPVFVTSCADCGGTDKECAKCQGTNDVRVYRCPKAILCDVEPWEARISRDVVRSFSAYAAWEAHGTLPHPGGLQNQTVGFAHALRILGAEHVRIDRIKRENQQTTSKLDKLRGLNAKRIRSKISGNG